MISNKRLSLGFGSALCLVFVFAAPNAWKSLGTIIDRQVAANSRLLEWKNAYEALLPVNAVWNSTYPNGNDTKDLVSLYRLFDLEKYNLKADVDLVRQTSASPVLVNNVAIGLQRLCIGSTADALQIRAANLNDLRLGLRQLSARKDVDVGTVEFTFNQDSGQPIVMVKGLCLKVRTDDDPASSEIANDDMGIEL